MRPLLLALTFLPAAAGAAPVLVPLSRGIELRTQALADPASADLVVQSAVQSRLLAARFGIRCVAGDAFGPKSPVVTGAACEVRDASGALFEVKVTGVFTVSVALEVRQTGTLAAASPRSPLDSLPADPEAGVLARYQVSSYAIDGSPVTSSFSSLVLRGDRSYVFGERRGRWSIVQGLLLLDGEYTGWGPGALSEDGHRLTFHSKGPRFTVSAALQWMDPRGVVLTELGPSGR
ncbi:MAG TPA: hypothetical protein VMH40_02955 [Myxococcaceae bacterium]|nr:hypothetical protein [Myxococcaceae bacterium]